MESENDMDRHKIVFEENEKHRVLRGSIIKEDDFFVWIQRHDGIKRLAKRLIVKIEEINDNNNIRGEDLSDASGSR